MSVELVPLADTPATTRWVEMLEPVAELARQIANTEFVPASFRNRPAVIAGAILYGQEIGIGPMQALAKIDIIEGRPAPRAELARALALAAGHEIWVEEQTNTRCTVAVKRRGSDHIQKATWTMDDAKKAGLDGKGNWRKFPRQMLLARASAEVVRQACPDVLGGIAYFAEELDVEGTPALPSPEPPKSQKRRAANVTPAESNVVDLAVERHPSAGGVVEVPLLPGEDERPEVTNQGTEHDWATPAQLRAIHTLYGKLGVTDTATQKHITQNVLNLPELLATHKNLTKTQASELLDQLKAIDEDRAEFVLDDELNPVGIQSVE